MRIGLLGYGVVGKGFFDLVAERTDIQIPRILCRRDIAVEGAEVTHDFRDILQDDTIDTVVELIGGLHPAYEYVTAAMEAGKNVVTANKALLAAYYDELLTLAEQKGVCLRCTAAVGGGIGWLSELERTRRTQRLSHVSGIMNGTCNYILHSMTCLGLDYGQALAQAQELGYAEADPTADVEGFDTWNKLLLSANVALGISLDKESVPVCGISAISAQDVEQFKAHNLICKLIATAKAQDGCVHAYVQPTLCPVGSQQAAVPANYNFITFTGSATGSMSLYGQGAGRYPTAHNVLQDCVDVMQGRSFYCGCGAPAVADNTEALRFYVRGASDAWLEAQREESWADAIVTKPVSVRQMHDWRSKHPGVFIAAVPDSQ